VPIYHVGEYQGHAYYVMPFLARGNIALHLKNYSENPRDAVLVVEKIARAVHQLHLLKILHRDIKPGNILLDAEGEPFLSDFGLIKKLDQDQSLTTSHQRLGTPAYMAPEQTGLLPESIGPATDIWGIGVVLYELLTGIRPFTAPKGEETTTLLWRIAHQEPRGPRAVAPKLDRGLEAIILKCLEKHPDKRFASANELANELRRWLDNQPLETRPPNPIALWWRRHPLGRRVAGAVAIVVVMAAVALPAYRHYADPERPLREIQHEFASIGRVELMRDNMPRWSEWAFGNADKPKRSDDGFLQLSSENLKMLVLAKDLPGPGVRLAAKIRHDLADSQLAEVGLFVAHAPPNTDPAAPRIFFRCAFNDVQKDQEIIDIAKVKLKLGNLFLLGYVFYAEPKDRDPFYDNPPWPGPFRFEPIGFHQRTWRDVSIEFFEDKLTAKFDGKLTRSLPISAARKKLNKTIAANMKYFPDAPAVSDEFETTGAIGLMITRGSASFKDIVVERIK
jgi:hypothetical protein